MADYVDALCDHHGGPQTGTTERGAFVHDLMRAHETALLSPLLDALRGRNDIRILGPSEPINRAPTVALSIGQSGEETAAALAEHGVMAGGGDFYAVRALSAMGVPEEEGVLRLSFTHYTSPSEIDQLISALDAVL